MEHSTFQLPYSLWTTSNYSGKIPWSDSLHDNVTLAFQFFNVLEPCQIFKPLQTNDYIGLQNKNTWWTFYIPSPIYCHRGHNRVILKI
jgi:hypothetical protein